MMDGNGIPVSQRNSRQELCTARGVEEIKKKKEESGTRAQRRTMHLIIVMVVVEENKFVEGDL
jgi:hypothetical protein